MENICNLCGRHCNINRDNRVGVCGASNSVKIAKVMIHKWEEPIIAGGNGSGAIFFANCNLKCVFCQNYEISSNGKGKEISIKELADIFRKLENMGVNNINLVTPTHYTYQIIEALKIYKPHIPIVWNTNSYETTDTIKLLQGWVNIFLFDLKYCNNSLGLKYSNVPDYYDVATKAIIEGRKIVGEDIICDGLMKRGIIIRHLVLPTHTDDSIKVLDWIADNMPNAIVSVMSQYTPYYKANNYPEINRKITKMEYKRVMTHVNTLGLNGYMQELSSATEDYIPNFNNTEIDF